MYIIKIDNLYFKGIEEDSNGNITGVYLDIDYNNAKTFASKFEADRIKNVLNILCGNIQIKELVIKE